MMGYLLKNIVKDIKSILIELSEKNIILECTTPKTSDNPSRVFHLENFERVKNRNEYIKKYKFFLENKQYICLFEDLSLIQAYYEFDNDGNKLKKASLIFYPNPGFSLNYELINKTNNIENDIITAISKYIRLDIDVDQNKYKEIHHPLAHIHLGFGSFGRIAIDKFPFFSEFIKLILFLNYPEKWKGLILNENSEVDIKEYLQKRIKSHTEKYINIGLTECEKKHYYFKI